MFAEPVKFMLLGAAVFAVLFNLKVIYLYILETIYFFFFEVELWTYCLFFGTIFVIGLAIFIRYWQNKTEITRLSYVNYLTEDEYERMKEETTREAMEKLQRSHRYMELRNRLEQEQRDKTRVNPQVSDVDDDEETD